jgi:hypothetical protein
MHLISNWEYMLAFACGQFVTGQKRSGDIFRDQQGRKSVPRVPQRRPCSPQTLLALSGTISARDSGLQLQNAIACGASRDLDLIQQHPVRLGRT